MMKILIKNVQVWFGIGLSFRIELGVGSEGFWGFEFVFCGFFGGFMKKIVWKYVVKGRV
jgi:hypothetical protein